MPGRRHRRQHRKRENELSANVLCPCRSLAESAGRAGTVDPMADQTNSRIRQTQVGKYYRLNSWRTLGRGGMRF